MPAGHTQADTAAAQDVPPEHATHVVAATPEYVPPDTELQLKHAVAALAFEYVPAGHAPHVLLELPEMPWYRPATHATHVPFAPLYPAPHTAGHAVAPA